TYEVSDGAGGFATETVTLTITGVNDAPVLLGASSAGGALQFTRNTVDTSLDTQVIVADDPALDAGTGDLTLEAWVYLTESGQFSAIMDKRQPDGNNGYTLMTTSTGALRLQLKDGATAANFDSTGTLSINQWHHVAVTLDRDAGVNGNGEVTFFLDGTQDVSVNLDGSGIGPATNIDSTGPLVIGDSAADASSVVGWNGQLDDIRVWDTARTAADIAGNYRLAAPADETGLVANWHFDQVQSDGTVLNEVAGGPVATLGDGVSAATEPLFLGPNVIGRALDFDGVDDVIDAGRGPTDSYALASDLTIETWINSDSWVGGSVIAQFADAGETEGTNNLFWLHVDANGNPTFGHETGAGIDVSQTLTGVTLPTGEWTHIALTRNAGSDLYTFYVNGQAVGTFDYTGSNDPTGGTTATLGIGDHSSAVVGGFDGRMADVRIWDTARTAGDIADNFQNFVDANDPNLLVNFRLDDAAPGASPGSVLNSADGTTHVPGGAPLIADTAPDIFDTFIEVREGASIRGDLLTFDVEGDPVTIAAVPPGTATTGGGGTYEVNADGTFVYTPAAGFFGQDSFTVTVTDSLDASRVETVTVEVVPDLIPTTLDTAADGNTATPDDFGTAANWSSGTVPTALDLAILTGAGSVNVASPDTFTVGALNAQADLSVDGTLTVVGDANFATGATLTVAGAMTVQGDADIDGTATLTGGLLTLNGQGFVDGNVELGFNAVLTVNGSLLVGNTGTLSLLDNTTVNGTGQVQNFGTVIIGEGGGNVTTDLVNNGTLDIDANLTAAQTGKTLDTALGVIDIALNQTLDIAGGTLVLGGGTTFTAATGTISFTGASNTLALDSNFLIDATTPAFDLGASQAVNIVAAANPTQTAKTLTVSATGSLTLDGNDTTDSFVAVIVDGNLTTIGTGNTLGNGLTVNGTVTVLGTTANSSLSVTGTVDNSGTILLDNAGGSSHVVTLTASGLITNNVASFIQVTNSGGSVASTYTVNANGGILNQGTLDIDANTQIVNVGTTLDTQNGIIDVAAGTTLTIGSGADLVVGTGTSLFGADAASAIDFAGGLTGTLSLASDFTLGAGSPVLRFGATADEVTIRSTVAATPHIFTIAAGAKAVFSDEAVTADITLNVNGELAVEGAGNTVDGPFSIGATGSLAIGGITANEPTTLTVANGFTNAGAITFDVQAPGGQPATLTVNGSGVITNDGTITFAVPASGATVYTLNAASIANNVTGDLVIDHDVTLNASVTNDGDIFIAEGATLNLSPISTLTNNGTISGDGTITLQAGATLTNDGTIEVGGVNQVGDFVVNGTIDSVAATNAFVFEIQGTTPATQYDTLTVTDIDLAGATDGLTLDFTGYTAADGDVFNIIAFTSGTHNVADIFDAGSITVTGLTAGFQAFVTTTTAGVTVTVEQLTDTLGHSIDGYVAGATVFADQDGDLILDAGEVNDITGASGDFTLTGGIGDLVLVGGTDISTGLAFDGVMRAPEGSTVITPLTTLVSALMDAGRTEAEALADAKTALGIPAGADILNTDPVAAVQSADPTAAANGEALMAAGVKVQNLLVIIQSTLIGVSPGITDAAAYGAAVRALENAVNGAVGAVDLTSAATVQAIVNDAGVEAGLIAGEQTTLTGFADEVATVIADLSQEVDDQVALGNTGTAFLENMAQVGLVAQRDAAFAIETAIANNDQTALTQAVTNYTGTNLDTTVADAANRIGDVNGGITGNDTAETLTGTADGDFILGFGGADTIDGLGGNDIISGGDGSDVLTGGTGGDAFVMKFGEAGTDTITDFDFGDRIDASDYAFNSRTLTLTQVGADTVLQDTTGAPVDIAVIQNTLAGDLILDSVEGAVFLAPVPPTVASDSANQGALIGDAEVEINTVTTGDQSNPTVTALANGNYVVAWNTFGSGSSDADGGVAARLFNPDGAPLTGEFLVNTTTTGFQGEADIAALTDGGFIVSFQNGGGGPIVAQRYDSTGAPVSADGLTPGAAEFTLSDTADVQRPDLQGLPGGGFVATWNTTSVGTDTDGAVVARLFNADGTAVGASFQVNTTEALRADYPAVDVFADGGFLIAWADNAFGSNTQNIRAQRFDASGAAVGSEFIVGGVTNANQPTPSVAVLADGGYVVTWASGGGVLAQRYDVDGNAVLLDGTTAGGAVSVGTNATPGFGNEVVATSDGGFIVSWSQENPPLSGNADVVVQRFNADGTSALGEVVVNQITADVQRVISVDVLPNDQLVTAWGSNIDFSGSVSSEIHSRLFDLATVSEFTEDGAPVAVDPFITLIDPDSPQLTGATVQITAGFVTGEDVLAFVDTPNITGTYNATTGLLTLSGTDTVAAYEAALRSITYANTNLADPNVAPRTISFQVDDGINLSVPFDATVNVLAVNDAPAIADLDGDVLTYAEASGAQLIDDSLAPELAASVSDVDNPDFAGGVLTVSVTANAVATEDRLGFGAGVTLSGTAPGSTVTVNAVQVGTLAATLGTGTDLVVSLNANATLANVTDLLRAITYENTNTANPGTAPRTIGVSVTDGAGGASNTANVTVNIVPANDAPVLTLETTITLTDSLQSLGTNDSRGVGIGDIDGDGDLDAIVANDSGSGSTTENIVYTNDGTGNLTNTSAIGLGEASEDVLLADFNGDGDLDIFFVGASGFANRVQLSNGVGGFTSATVGGTTTLREGGVFGDIDGDNDIDVITFSPTTGASSEIYTNDGSGTFTVANLEPGPAFLSSVNGALGDIDGDLDLDLVVANSQGGANQVWLNDGSGNFTVTGQNLGGENSWDVKLGDLDGDGDLDAFFANITGTGNTVYFNNAGTFTSSGQSLGAGDSRAVDLADMDGDGDLDAVVTNRDANATEVWLNDGSGFFTDSGVGVGPSFGRNVALGDFDGDGVTDVFVSVDTGGANKVFFNDTPQIDSVYLEDSGAVAVTNLINVTDIDSPTLDSATVQITGGYVNGEDILAFAGSTNITGSFNAATGTLTLTGPADPAEFQAALNAVTYENTNTTSPAPGPREISFTVSDGVTPSATVSKTITVAPVNDAPVIQDLSGDVLTYSEGSGAQRIDDAIAPEIAASIIDPDGQADFFGGSLAATVSVGLVATEDLLGLQTGNVTISGTTAGSTVSVLGTVVGTLGNTLGAGSNLVVNFDQTGHPTLAEVNEILRAITYENTNLTAPDPTPRTISVTVNDGLGGVSTAADVTVNIVGANDAPVVEAFVGVELVSDGFDSAGTTPDTNLWSTNTGVFASSAVTQATSQVTLTDGGILNSTQQYTPTAADPVAVSTVFTIPSLPSGFGGLFVSTRSDGVPEATSFGVQNGVSLGIDGGGIFIFETTAGTSTSLASDTSLAGFTFTTGVEYRMDVFDDGFDLELEITQVSDPTNTISLTATSSLAPSSNFVSLSNFGANAAGSTTVLNDVTIATEKPIGAVPMTEDVPLDGQVFAFDPDGDSLTFTLNNTTPAAKGSVVVNPNGTFTYTPNQDANGTDSFQVDVFDGTTTTTQTVTVNIAPVNDGPALATTTVTPSTFVEDGSAVAVDPLITVTDIDSASMTSATVRIATNFNTAEDVLNFTPTGTITGSYDGGTGVLSLSGTGTLAEYQAVLRSVTYANTNLADPDTAPRTVEFQVVDDFGVATLLNATVNVQAVNDTPIVESVGFELVSDDFNDGTLDTATRWSTALSGNTGAAVTETAGHLELANGGYLISQQEFSPTVADPVAVSATVTLGGTLGDDAVYITTRTDGVPASSAGFLQNGLSIGFGGFGAEIIQFSGGTPSTIASDLSLTGFTLTAGTAYRMDVFDDGTNIELTLTEVADPTNTFTLTGTSAFTSPTNNFVAFSNNGTSVISTVDDAVIGTEKAIGTPVPLTEDTVFQGQVFAFDPDGDSLTFTLNNTTPAAKGSVVVNADGTFTYTPTANANGTDSFQVDVFDGTVTTTQTITVNIAPVNDDPVLANNVTKTVSDGTTVTIVSANLLVTDVDNTDTELTYTVTTIPVNGTLFLGVNPIAANGTFTQQDIINGAVTYQNAAGGGDTSDSFTFTVSDGAGGVITAQTFNFTVTADLTGNAIDGYLEGATVFADANGNGVFDVGEATDVTGFDGDFTLTGATGDLILTGGTDVSTGLFFEGALRAPAGSTVITPLTTIVAGLIDAGQTASGAESIVETALGIPAGVDLLNFDPVAATRDSLANGTTVMGAGAQVQNAMVIVLGALFGADADTSIPDQTAFNAIGTAMANLMVAQGAAFDLTNTAQITSLMNDTAITGLLDDGAGGTETTAYGNAIANTATVISNLSAQIDALATTGTAFLEDVARIGAVAQGQAAFAIEDAIFTGGDLNAVAAQFSGASLTAAIANAVIGDVDGATFGVDDINPETINGTAGNDIIDGGAGVDTINGLSGDDILFGGDGNDTLDGGTGRNLLHGGAGDDFLTNSAPFNDPFENRTIADYRDVTTSITVTAATDQVTGDATVGTDTLGTIDGVFGGSGDDVFDMTGWNNSQLNSFSDATVGSFNLVRGGAGDDTITGSGATRVSYSDADEGVIVILDNVADDGSGFAKAASNTTDALGTGDSVGFDTFTGGVAEIQGSDFNDTLTGNDLNNVLRGGGGDDTLDGGGQVTLTGGDRADYRSDEGGITVTYAAGAALDATVNDGTGGTDTLISIEQVRGSQFDDVFIGNDAINRFRGERGADTFTGGAGADRFEYTLGTVESDQFVTDVITDFGTGADTLRFNGMDGVQLLTAAFTYAGDIATTIANITADTGIQNRVVFFQDGTDGYVYVKGTGTGATSYDGTLIKLLGRTAPLAGTDVRDLNGVALVEDAGVNVITGTVGPDSLTGTAGADSIVGLDGDDVLDGGIGNDTLEGGDGSNRFIGGAGSDTLIGGTRGLNPFDFNQADYRTAPGAITVNLGAGGTTNGTASDGEGGTDTLISIGGILGSSG
ncbi:MAG: hypothetical protein COW30_07515, partial [Rhodospirillales bacterium CG15_BIG_FIL_POST_REV_8_21_14_020_66_15]